MDKSTDAFRTISEVADELDLPQHVLRFWETRFPQIKPLKRAGGRRYYRPRDIEVLRAIKHLLYKEGYTIKGVQRLLREQGIASAAALADRSRESHPDFPHALEHVLPEIERGGDDSVEPFAPEAPDGSCLSGNHAGGAGTAGEMPTALGLKAEHLARLRAALAELSECEEILAAARRR